MSTSPSQLDQADRELLVAYLDGELPPEDSAVVESRLASDESFRRELKELERTWETLSHLPRPAAAEEFTRTTLEMVALAAQGDVEAATTALPSRRRRYAARVIGLVIAGLLVGVLLARIIWPDRNEELVGNLPVIENVETYRHLGDMQFLRRLHEEHGDDLERVSPLREADVNQAREEWRTVSMQGDARRRERLTNLESAAAGRLQAKWKQFESLTEGTQEQLQTLHEDLLQDEQADELYATAIRLGELLSRRSAGEKADLRAKTSLEDRLAVVASWLRRERPHRQRDLTDEDRAKLIAFSRDILSLRRERRDEGPPTEEEREAFEQKLDTLVESLSPAAQEDLKEDDGETHYRELMHWIWEATPSRHQPPEDLEWLFVGIDDNDEKARLLLLPFPEMYRELREHLPFEDGWRRDRDRRGPPGDGGRRRGGGGPDRRGGDRDGRGDDRDDDRRRGGFRGDD